MTEQDINVTIAENQPINVTIAEAVVLGSGSASVDALNDIGDVVITSVTGDEIIVYDTSTSKWVNKTGPEANLTRAPFFVVSNGDGSGDYDGTTHAAIQSALDAANTAGGGTVFIKAGTYDISTTLSNSSYVVISGEGDSTVLKPQGDVNCITAAAKICIKNIQIDGSDQTNQYDAIRITTGADYSIVENVQISNVTRAGIYCTESHCNFNNVHCYNVGRGSDEGRGIWIATGADNCKIIQCTVRTSSRYGYLIDNATYCSITNSSAITCKRSDESSGRGLYISSSTNVTINDCHFSDCSLTGINCTSGSQIELNNILIDNISNSIVSEARGIEVDSCSFVNISNCVIDTCDDYGVWLNSDDITIISPDIRNVATGIRQGSSKTRLNIICPKFTNIGTANYDLSSALEPGFIIDDSNMGVNTTKPAMGVEFQDRPLILDAGNFETTKYDSQGTQFSTTTGKPNIIFNADSNDRPEISWFRGTRTYPEFSIRQHTTNDSGGELYAGQGTAQPIKTISFESNKTSFKKTLEIDTGTSEGLSVKLADPSGIVDVANFWTYDSIRDMQTGDGVGILLGIPDSDATNASSSGVRIAAVKANSNDADSHADFELYVNNGTGLTKSLVVQDDGTFQLPTYTTSGFIKNDASGNISGGNSISLTDLSDYDENNFILADGSNTLTSDWDAGSFEIRAQTFESDVTTGTAPFTVASTTVVTNLNADKVDGYDFNQSVGTGDSVQFAAVGINESSPEADFHMNYGQVLIDSIKFTGAKFNSQGVAWSSVSTLPAVIFNAEATDRPEISWYRGTRTYPEFSIRQHATNDKGGYIYSGNGLTGPTLTMVFEAGTVIIPPMNSAGFVKNSASGLLSGGNSISLTDLSDYDENNFILADGTNPLTADWDAGSFEIRAQTFESDVTTGTAPFTVASTTVVTNLNADKVDGYDFNQSVGTGDSVRFDKITFGSAAGVDAIAFYNTADETTNTEYVTMGWVSNVFFIQMEQAGSGGNRALTIRSDQGSQADVDLTIDSNATSSVNVSRNSGTTGKTYFNVNGTASQSSSTVTFSAITPTVNQSGTAGYTGLLINPTETGTGSGTKNLIDAQVDGISKFTVDNTGATTVEGVIAMNAGGHLSDNDTLTLGNTRASPDSTISSNGTHIIIDDDSEIALSIGTTEQLSLTDGALSPTTTDDINLGSITKKYKRIYTQDVHIEEDFLGISQNLFTSAAVLGQTNAIYSETGGSWRQGTSGTDNNTNAKNGATAWKITKNPIFECRLIMEQTALCHMRFGMFNISDQGFFFKYDTDDTDSNWQCHTVDADSSEIDDSGSAVDTDWHVFRIEATSSVVTFYIDGLQVGQCTDVNDIFTSDVPFRFAIQTREAASKYFRIDYLKMWQDR